MNETVRFDVQYIEQRNRLTVFFRMILAIPHIFVAGVWGYFAGLLAFFQWFAVLFTGKRNQGMWELQNQWLGYSSRAVTYYGILHDVFPPFGSEVGAVPVSYHFGYVADANRLSNFFRYFWMIPAMFISIFWGIGAAVLGMISWFAILFTGKMPRGMFDFMVKAQRFSLRLNAYAMLMTDTYPNADA